MSNSFEKFMRDNRRDFDTELPNAGVWEKIESTLPARNRRFTLRHMVVLSAAASIVFIALTSIYFLSIRKNSHGRTDTGTATTVNQDELQLGPEYAATFKEVYRVVGERQEELKQLTSNRPALYQQFKQDLSALDSSYQALRKQASQSANRDLIIQAMIDNLRLQAELLSRQLMISYDINQTQKKQSHEKEI